MQTTHYPFSAIIGQDEMKTALLLNAVDPSIGGVLIRGQKGTGKSTASRALAALLPAIEVVAGCPYHCAPKVPQQMHDGCLERFTNGEQLPVQQRPMPVVELPLSATEDRVVGTVHLEHALKTGQRRFEPGLLAAANRGILYVDEVNLLEDHLVDLLLDAAASGVNRVEREGLCITHPASFMLIGTMNPEEGELRPQFLDRFGLMVNVEGLENAEQRQAVVAQRLAFETNPDEVLARCAEEEQLLAGQVVIAREQLLEIAVSPDAMELAVKLAIELKVHGHRADIALLKVARALAALFEVDLVEPIHIRDAARFVLPHRLPGGAMLSSEASRVVLDAALRKLYELPAEIVPEPLDEQEDFDAFGDESLFPGSAASGTMLFNFLKKKLPNRS